MKGPTYMVGYSSSYGNSDEYNVVPKPLNQNDEAASLRVIRLV